MVLVGQDGPTYIGRGRYKVTRLVRTRRGPTGKEREGRRTTCGSDMAWNVQLSEDAHSIGTNPKS
jgi:hypothetical protein